MTSDRQHQQKTEEKAPASDRPTDEAAAIATRVQDELLRIVETLDVPSSPIAISNADAAAGICFLDLAMNSNHVVKESEHLSLIDRNYLARQIHLDLSLNLLTPDQRDVAVNYNYQRHTPGESTDLGATHEEDADDRIWLPVTRVDRLITAKMEIIDDEEHLVPQLAQTEILQVISAAMIFTYAEVKRDAASEETNQADEPSASNVIEDKQHWLIRAAIATIVQNGADLRGRNPKSARTKADAVHVASYKKAGGSPSREPSIHEKAQSFIEADMDPTDPHWQAFYHLLYKVATEYVIVAGFDWKHTEHQISYTAPALPSKAERSLLKNFARWTGLSLLVNDSYCIQYTRECKTSLREFHIDLETEFDVNIRSAVLTSDRDEFDCYMTEKQKNSLARLIRKYKGRHHGLIQNDVNRINTIMSFLANRRRAQQNRSTDIRERDETTSRERRRVIGGETQRSKKRSLWTRKPELDLPLATEKTYVEYHDGALKVREHTFDSRYLGMGATVSDDQRQNIAHAFWKVSPQQLTPRASTRTYRKTFAAVLADDQPSYVGQVAWLLFGLWATVVVIGGSLFRDGVASKECDLSDPLRAVGDGVWRYTQVLDGVSLANADALVAVLLIVPGILLNRLENSPRDLVLQWLRLPARNLAYFGVFSTTALSLAIALFDSGDTVDGEVLCAPSLGRVFLAGTYFIAFLTVLAACGVVTARVRMKHSGVPAELGPKWLPLPPRLVRVEHIDGRFEAVGSGQLADAKTEDRTGELLAAMSAMFLPRGEDVVILARMVASATTGVPITLRQGLTLERLTSLTDDILEDLRNITQGQESEFADTGTDGSPGESKDVQRRRANRTEVSLTCGPAEPALVFVSTTAVPGTIKLGNDKESTRSGTKTDRQGTSSWVNMSVPRSRSLTFKARSRIDLYVGRTCGSTSDSLRNIIETYVKTLKSSPWAVLSYVEWPAVKPYLDHSSNQSVGTAASKPRIVTGVRLGFDVENASLDKGIELLFKFVDVLDDCYELLVRDSRGPLRDNWRKIHPSGSPSSCAVTAAGEVGELHVRTFIGPIRAGSTCAILKIYGDTIVGLSESTLDRFSVISVWSTQDLSVSKKMQKLLSAGRELADYRVLWESSDPVSRMQTDSNETATVIWCNWNVPMQQNALKKIINTLDAAISERAPDWSVVVDYADTKLAMPGRQIGLASLRVTSKGSVETSKEQTEGCGGGLPCPDDKTARARWEDKLSTTCRDVQERWRRKLEGEFSGRADVQVVWRDSWLRRWSHRR